MIMKIDVRLRAMRRTFVNTGEHLFSKYLFCGWKVIYCDSFTHDISYRKSTAELIHGWEIADGHLEKRHLSSDLSREFSRGGKIINAFPLRAAPLLYRKSRPYGGLLNREDSEKKGWKVATMEGSRSWGSRQVVRLSHGRNHHAMRETDQTLEKSGVAKTPARPSHTCRHKD